MCEELLRPVATYVGYFEEYSIMKLKNLQKLRLKYVGKLSSSGNMNRRPWTFHSSMSSKKFMKENEENGNISFADVQIKKPNNGLMTSVYRKPTYKGRYLNVHSNYSPSMHISSKHLILDWSKPLVLIGLRPVVAEKRH